jgi:hypothetical protein
VGWKGAFFIELIGRGRDRAEIRGEMRGRREKGEEIVWRCKFAGAFEFTQVSKVNH